LNCDNTALKRSSEIFFFCFRTASLVWTGLKKEVIWMLPAFFGIAFCYRYLLTDINVKRLHNRHELNYHAAVLTFKLLFYKQGGGSLGKVITPQKGFTTFKLGLFYKNVYYSS